MLGFSISTKDSHPLLPAPSLKPDMLHPGTHWTFAQLSLTELQLSTSFPQRMLPGPLREAGQQGKSPSFGSETPG